MTVDTGSMRTSPFLKWAGGKQWLAPRLVAALPDFEGRYFEPFVGGGSLFFALSPERAFLSDANSELICCYGAVRDDADRVIRRLRQFEFTKDCYHRVRSSRPRSPVGRAARFLYLNRTCWNGLYRVNQLGEFNVPMGKFGTPPDFVQAERLREAREALRGVRLVCDDFERATRGAREGDFVYLDPPYVVTHENNGFIRYNESIFSWEDQNRLATCAARLAQRGVNVVVSNAAHKTIRVLYEGFEIRRIRRKSLLAADGSRRRTITEYLISSFPFGKQV